MNIGYGSDFKSILRVVLSIEFKRPLNYNK